MEKSFVSFVLRWESASLPSSLQLEVKKVRDVRKNKKRRGS